MSFIGDLKKSEIAIDVVIKYLNTLGIKNIKKLSRDMQHKGDIEYYDKQSNLKYCEIKYDLMCKKTGNMCFETHNKKGKLTGISSTEADEVHYVVPDKEGFTLYMFKTEDLKSYLFDAANASKFKSVSGGDRRATFMLLVKRVVIEEDGIAYGVEKIDA